MSKSLGNFFTVRDVLAKAPGEAIRYNMLGTHYRQPVDWTDAGLLEAKGIMDTLYQALRSVQDIEAELSEEWPEELCLVLEDDLNTHLVRGVLRNLARDLNKATSAEEKSRLKGSLLAAGNAVGLLQEDPEDWFKNSRAGALESDVAGGLRDEKVDELIAARADARAEKNFERADDIRTQLAEVGVILEDKPDGSTNWRRN